MFCFIWTDFFVQMKQNILKTYRVLIIILIITLVSITRTLRRICMSASEILCWILSSENLFTRTSGSWLRNHNRCCWHWKQEISSKLTLHLICSLFTRHTTILLTERVPLKWSSLWIIKKRIHHQVTLNPLVIYCLTTVTHRQDYSSVSHFSVFNNNTAPSLRATLPRHCH